MARFIIMKPADNVATALEEIPAGTSVEARGQTLVVRDPIPFGHKFALVDIPQGAPVIKYGEVIGTATVPIRAGQHTHVHNVESNRGRGDKAGAAAGGVA